MPTDNQNATLLIIAVPTIILFIWVVILQINLSRIKKNQKVFFGGKEAKDLEKIILENKKRITSIDGDIKDLYEITKKIHFLADKGLHKMGLIRFNPFRDIGGDQSFSLAITDGEDNGVVVSSLYSRDGVRIYAKALKNGKSEKYPLTEEEKHAIKMASIEKDGQTSKKVV